MGNPSGMTMVVSGAWQLVAIVRQLDIDWQTFAERFSLQTAAACSSFLLQSQAAMRQPARPWQLAAIARQLDIDCQTFAKRFSLLSKSSSMQQLLTSSDATSGASMATGSESEAA
jgi:hypothetical protein